MYVCVRHCLVYLVHHFLPVFWFISCNIESFGDALYGRDETDTDDLLPVLFSALLEHIPCTGDVRQHTAKVNAAVAKAANEDQEQTTETAS